MAKVSVSFKDPSFTPGRGFAVTVEVRNAPADPAPFVSFRHEEQPSIAEFEAQGAMAGLRDRITERVRAAVRDFRDAQPLATRAAAIVAAARAVTAFDVDLP